MDLAIGDEDPMTSALGIVAGNGVLWVIEIGASC